MDESNICPYCGEALVGRQRKKCGKPECKRAFNAARAIGYMAAYRVRQKAQGKKRNQFDCYTHVCESCGKAYKSNKLTQHYCSVECFVLGIVERQRQRRERQRQRRLPILHPNPAPASVLHPKHPARRWAPTSSGRVWVMGWCKRCGEAFVIVDQLAAQYCSPGCSAKANRHTRRLRKYGSGREPYRNEDIYERDGWRCHICKRKVKKTDDYTHPLSPVVDHLVPLSRGGVDAPGNLACAHRLCNSKRTDRGAAQLLLFG